MDSRDSDGATLVRRAREDAGISQRALAALAGVKQPNLAAIEAGTRKPSAELLARILGAARMRPSIPLELFADRILELAPKYGVSDIRVFGSAAHGTDTAESDIDLLVDASPSVDFLTLAAFRQEVSDLLGFPVDAVVDDDTDPIVRSIRREAVPL
ncbi:helix-turn-helix domain-containing protein [Agromyces sp. NPDC055520]